MIELVSTPYAMDIWSELKRGQVVWSLSRYIIFIGAFLDYCSALGCDVKLYYVYIIFSKIISYDVKCRSEMDTFNTFFLVQSVPLAN